MPGDDERKPGKVGADSGSNPSGGSGPSEREPRMPLSELLRRGLSAGQAVSETLFPRELASSLASQLVDARHGLVNAIAIEVGRFLRQADIASEMRKVLAGLNVEASIHLRFSEDKQGKIQSELDVKHASAGPKPSSGGGKSKPPPPNNDEP